MRSATRALEHVGANVTLTSDRAIAENADGLVVPGVGAFAAVMEGLARPAATRSLAGASRAAVP